MTIFPRAAVMTFSACILLVCLAQRAEVAETKALLVQKVMEPKEEMGPVQFETGQVQIVSPDGRTKLLPYRSHLDPLIADDRVFMLTTKDGLLTAIVVYDLEKGHGQEYPLPKYLHPYFSCPSFSPDGTKLAHYEVTKPGKGRVLVRSWPAGKILQQSQNYDVVPTDVPPYEPTWKTPLMVEFDPDFFQPARVVSFHFEKK